MTIWRHLPFSSKPHNLHVIEGRQSPVPISEKFTDNKAECILQGWTFSPRMSHYQGLIMLISQPLESCPAFHCQKWERKWLWLGAAPYLVKYSPSVPSCNSLYEASWFMATAVLDLLISLDWARPEPARTWNSKNPTFTEIKGRPAPTYQSGGFLFSRNTHFNFYNLIH